MAIFLEKFQDLHQRLANCRNELVMLRLEIGKQGRVSGKVSKYFLKEEKRLLLEEIRLEQEIKNLS